MSMEPRHNGLEAALGLLDALEDSLEGIAEQPKPRSVEGVGVTLHELRGVLQGLSRDRRLHDQKLQEAQRQGEAQQRQLGILQSLLSHTKTQLAYLDPRMHFVEVNPAYVEGCGYSRGHLIGRNHFELFPNAENQAIFEHVVQTGVPVEYVAKPFEFPERPELGTTYWDWTLQPDLDEQGQVRGLVLSLLDVTERERTRREREQRLEWERRLLQVSEQVLQETTTQGLLQTVVDAARDLTHAGIGIAGQGYSDGTFRVGVTSRMEDLSASTPGEEFNVQRGRAYLQILKAGKTVRLTEGELEAYPDWWGLSDGLLGAPLLDRSGQPVGLIMLFDKQQGEFTAEDEGILARLAALASLGLLHITAREQAERHAAELGGAFAAIPDGMVIFDGKGHIAQANAPARAMLGYGPSQETASLSERLSRWQLQDEQGQLLGAEDVPLLRAMRGEMIHDEVLRAQRLEDGGGLWLAVSAAPIKDVEGNVISVAMSLRDVTELTLARRNALRLATRLQRLRDMDEAVLSARSARETAEIGLACLRELVQCSYASVALFDPHGQRVHILAAKCDDAMHLKPDGEGLAAQGSYLAPLLAGDVQVIEGLGASGDLAEAARQLLAATGMQSSAHVPLLVEGELIGSLNLGWGSPGRPSDEALEIARGIADEVAIGIQQARLQEQLRHHGEELERQVTRRTAALASSRARLQAIVESAPLGIAVLDERGAIVQSNQALCQITGYAADELKELSFSSLVAEEDAGGVAAALAETSSQPATHQRQRHRVVRKDGQVRWANTTATQVKAEGGSASQILAMVDDITEEKRAHDELIQAEKLALTGRLAASVAHEINNPLQSVIGCLSLVEEAAAEGADFRQYLQVARDELRRAADIIARLRDVHRPSREEDKKPVPINELLYRVLTLTQKRAADGYVQVSWAPAEDLPTVTGLPDRLQQVFLNLVLNGIDATSGRGCLEVQTRSTDDPVGVEVTIRDSGAGIDASMRASLFEPFQTTKPGGLGLGLYVSRRIVENHGGRIEVSSELGKGSTFTVWLPA